MTTPTQNNIPSSTAIDVRFNAEKLDEIINSDNETYTDRFGNERLTAKGISKLITDFYDSIEGLSGSNQIGTETGQKLAKRLEGYGVVFLSVIDFLKSSVDSDMISVRGFYTENDGGAATWAKTGVVDQNKKSSHVITEAKIYNANGVEYQIVLNNTISPLQNGLRSATYAQCIADSEDFICLGEAINGIFSQLPVPVYTSNVTGSYTAWESYRVVVPPNIYRLGRAAIKLYNNATYDFSGSSVFVYAAPSRKFSVVGERLNCLEHGYDEVKEKWQAISGKQYWGSISAQNIRIRGGKFVGDHDIKKTAQSCSAGVGVLVLNPEYVFFDDVEITGFNWCAVTIPAQIKALDFSLTNKFDDNNLDYKYICDFLGSARYGNFYGANFTNCRFHGGRRGVLRSGVDWSFFKGGICTNDFRWRSPDNVSGEIPDYTMVITGNGFTCEGAYISTNGGLSEQCNPGKAVVYTSAKGHFFSGIYTEWTYTNFMISKYTWANGSQMRSMGLQISSVTQYKNANTGFGFVAFEDQCFGHYDANDQWVNPDQYSQFPIAQGLHTFSIGSPNRDDGAFLHSGYDFKYGTYNLGYSGDIPDVDVLRDQKTSKEFINPWGLQVNKGTILLPLINPQKSSHICIWIKDLTNTYDYSQISMWLTAALENPVTNNNDWLQRAELTLDYGNGYKLLTIINKRFSANDGVGSWSPQQALQITVPENTPIILKAVECYNGGVPFFPGGCQYIPQSSMKSLWGSNVYNGMHNGMGGGIFKAGDMVNPWIGVDKHNVDFKFASTLSTEFNDSTQIIKSGVTLETAFKTTFTSQIIAVDNVNLRTTISIPSSNVALVMQGVPIYVSSGSSLSKTGPQRIIKRILNSNGSATLNYVIDGVLGNVGDNLVINQSLLPGYASYNDKSFNTLKLLGGVNSSSPTSGTLMVTGGGGFSGNIYGGANGVFTGQVTASNITSSSDERLKFDFEEVDEALIDIAKTVAPKHYRLKSDPEKIQIGFVAQEIIFEFKKRGLNFKDYSLVIEDEFGFYSVNYDCLMLLRSL